MPEPQINLGILLWSADMISKISVMFASGISFWFAWVMLLFRRIGQALESLFGRHLPAICPHKYYILLFRTNINLAKD